MTVRPGHLNAAIAWLRANALPTSGRLIVGGGPGFVYAVVDALEELGVTGVTIESDVFSYAPR